MSNNIICYDCKYCVKIIKDGGEIKWMCKCIDVPHFFVDRNRVHNCEGFKIAKGSVRYVS